MSWLTDLIGKGMDKLWPDKSKAREQQTALNAEELKGAPSSKLRLWRSFLGWALALCFVWEVMLRPSIVTYWPHLTLPPSMLEEVCKLLLFMLGGAF
jgi:hypothetical protein